MSLEKDTFRYEDGETGFLAGIISELTDDLNVHLSKITNQPFMCIEADIYRIEDKTLEQAIKDRATKSWFGSQQTKVEKDNLIKKAKLFLKQIKVYENITEAMMYELIPVLDIETRQQVMEIVKMYENKLMYHVSGSIKVFEIQAFPHQFLSSLYTYIIIKSIAIQIESFCIIMLYGSNE